jgi:serine/threonine protein phosphatase PrpC
MLDDERPRPAGDPEEDTGELPPLLAPGDVLAGRYRVLDMLSDADGPAYRAEDLARCAVCGASVAASRPDLCPACGAPRERGALCTIRLVPVATRPPAGGEVLQLHGLAFLIVPEQAGLAASAPSGGLRLSVGVASDPGRVRTHNQDSLLYLNVGTIHRGRASVAAGLFAVADGMGGLAGGAAASHFAVQHLASHFGARLLSGERAAGPPGAGSPDAGSPDAGSPDGGLPDPERRMAELAAAVQDANRALHARCEPGRVMGTTLTSAYIEGRTALIANVGDSRTYRWHAGRLEQLTTDHSMVAGLVRAGLARPEELRTHPRKNVITRSLGENPSVEVDTFRCPLDPGDRLVLCSDGVWDMLPDEELAAVLRAEADPQQAARAIVARANAKGGEDNLSVIVVACEALEDG